jgi:hypothetical protein
MKRARVYVDHGKLMEQIKKIGFTANRVAIGLGYNSSVFCNARDRGYFSEEVAERLERVYGIKRKTYEIAEPKKEEPKPVEAPKAEEPKAEEPKCSIDYVRLYNTIYQAVLTALQENAKGMRDRLFELK